MTSAAGKKLADLTRASSSSGPWHVGQVSGVNGNGTVDVDYLGFTDTEVPCLNNFTPAVGDLVLILLDRHIGSIVHGRIPRRN